MIKSSTLAKLADAGLQLDMLGHPLKVGDLILTKSYGSPALNCFAYVTKVNKKSIMADVKISRLILGNYAPRPAGHTGMWNYYPDREVINETKPMKRTARECLRISPEQQELATQREEELIDQYPELFI